METIKFEEKRKSIKKRKRLLTSIKSHEYGKMDSDGRILTNKEIKKEKEDLKREYRAIKHSEKNEIRKEIKEIINGKDN